MKYNPQKHHRRSIRLKDYDYSQAGLYFITICVKNRECLFGEIINGKMILNDVGKMVITEWLKIPERFKNVRLHEYIVMPNHFHTIFEIVGATIGKNIDETIGENVGKNIGENVGATLVVAQNMVAQNTNDQNINSQNINFQNQHRATTRVAPTGVNTNAQNTNATKKTVGDIVGAFQSIVTVEYIRGVKNKNWKPFDKKLWQRNYWEHIIRSDKSYQRISEYIQDNPTKWKEDKFFINKP